MYLLIVSHRRCNAMQCKKQHNRALRAQSSMTDTEKERRHLTRDIRVRKYYYRVCKICDNRQTKINKWNNYT